MSMKFTFVYILVTIVTHATTSFFLVDSSEGECSSSKILLLPLVKL